jgi:hypothetical protein
MMTTASVDDFIMMLQKLLHAAWGASWGELIEGLPVRDQTERVDLPKIIATLKDRVPAEDFRARKPKKMSEGLGTFQGPDEIYLMWFDVTMEFGCYGNTHAQAKNLSSGLEEILTMFAGYFKEKGVDEIRFLREYEPTVESERRIPFPCRHLVYGIRIKQATQVQMAILQRILTDVVVAGNPPEGG